MSSVDDVLENQQQLASAIESIYTNFKKDSSSRKTAENIRKRLDTLDSYWVEYERNFSQLSTAHLEPATRDFIYKDMERVKDRYGNIRAHIQNFQLTAEERPQSPIIKPPSFIPSTTVLSQDNQNPSGSKTAVHTATVSKSEEMLRMQNSNFKAFHRTVTGINLDTVIEKWEFQDLLQAIQSRWAAIDKLHWELDSQVGRFSEEYENAYSSYESKFQTVKRDINKKMWSKVHMEKSTPHMEVPTFSGHYNSWVSFKDLFVETIHSNHSLSNAQKMQYLKSKVKGEAERLIQHLQISSDNYEICWNILNQRYNNKKLIFTSHMNSLMGLPVIQHQSVALIKRMHDTTQECLNAIKNLGVDITSWDPMIVHILSQKLDATTFTDYIESLKDPRELPKLIEFLQFLEVKFTSLEATRRKPDISTNKHLATNKNEDNIGQQKPNFYKNSFTSSKVISQPPHMKKYKCFLCHSDDHGIYFCRQFIEMTPYNRLKMVNKLNLCQNCLSNHYGKPCMSLKVCSECSKAHNRLLHKAFAQPQRIFSTVLAGSAGGSRSGEGSNARSKIISADTTINDDTVKEVRSSSHVSLQNDALEVLLPTAMVKVQAVDGSTQILRALLDQGSQTSLITEHAAQLLKLPRMRCKGVISGVGDKESNCKGMITINCSSIVSDFSFETEVLVMKQLIKNLPSYTFANPDWSYLNHIKLADPEFYKSRPVDVLLGADIYSTILMDGICRANTTLPTAQQTQLGWILSGNVKTFQCNVILNNISEIQNFWEIEDISERSELSTEDKECIEFYQSTTTRREDGSYEVRLPMKSDYERQLGQSKAKTIAQFYKLEKRLQNNPIISKDYISFINEYLSLGHMTPVMQPSEIFKCYLPHHSVSRVESTTTKLRVVFNASDKTSSGLSLNDVMRRGPNLQQDLQTLIIKWRQHKYAITADIEKMFRQIWINNKDQYLQMIVWRDDKNEKLQEYKLTTVTYGTKAAPFLAMMTLKQLAKDEEINFSASSAPKILEESFYMDDLIHGTHSVQTAKKLKTDMISLLSAGGFKLRKWKSNSPELLDDDDHITQQEHFNFKQGESTKALGLRWNPRKDYFTFESKFEPTLKLTKRNLLSEISKIFDPLGWISPLTTKLKILFQDMWRANIQWDDMVPKNICDEWNRIREDISTIDQYKIPRWLQTKEKERIELHGFCDSSTKAYGCVVYCKINKGNSVSNSIVLVAGKTKLVPLKKNCSLPRLELCGAVLLAKLMSKIKKSLEEHDIVVFGWVDSMVVLGWLNGDADRWKPFVANRVKQIIEQIPATCWRYVPSKDNPADCASRGLTASQLKEHNLWWQGPSWLRSISCIESEKQKSYVTNQDLKKFKQVNVTISEENEVIQFILNRYSSFKKAIRILAWVLRFNSKTKRLSYLSVEELNKSRNIIIKSVQHKEFAEEISRLKAGNSISHKSTIINLNPMLDENDILRVRGRLRHANMDSEMKHPIIIPSRTRLADVIIDQSHELTFHGGARLTISFIRRKYWLIGGINATKKRLRRCVKCRKLNPQLQSQLMGDLPSSRINPSRPFYHCGVDYTGHVNVKANSGRGIRTTKGYIAVFVCMATKAVHLELVSSLTTSCFLSALRRMAARRGLPRHIYSDQGKNFIGADKVLKQELTLIKQTLNKDFMSEISNMGIEWHFNAPSWPSAGGLWEAAVKSLKYHLKRVIGEQNLTFEEFSTLLAQLEGCLNSRPLCTLTEDPEDLDFLTPSHFLASGSSLVLFDTEKDHRTRWHLTQKIFQDVWRRWREEYLTQLTLRSKWKRSQKNINLNDVVVIKDDNLPAGKWSLGRVVELHPGSDGYVRVVTLKTKNGFLRRPIVKLSILPVNQDQAQDDSPNEKNT